MERIKQVLGLKAVAILLPALCLWLSWSPIGLVFPAFIAFVPLLLYPLLHPTRRYFYVLYPSLFLFNLSTTWWVWNASAGGAVFMLLANTLLMTLPFLAYRFTLRSVGLGKALMAFVFYWLGFEFFHFNWDISFPWLTLGNIFAATPALVQWYEFTGVLGGSLWVLLFNAMIAKGMITSFNKPIVFTASSILLIPILFSLFRYFSYQEPEGKTLKVSIIQPNIDPYEKFSGGEEIAQVTQMIQLAKVGSDTSSGLFILPETAVTEYIDEDWADDFESIALLRNWMKEQNAFLLTGVSSYHFFKDSDKPSVTARKTSDNRYYDSYNAALLLSAKDSLNWYHKSKLVPGVEKMPYPGFFRFLEPFAIDMGGITGSLGSSLEPMVFNAGKEASIAPLICYESIYGDYVRAFSLKGANLLAVITNDGWWGNTPGYRQHLQYARLRAIENRRYVVRSANTGISAVINSRGDVLQKTSWWEPAVINADVKLLNETTPYMRSGDFLGRFALFLGIFFFLGIWVKQKVK